MFLHQQMNMVTHQAVSIDVTRWFLFHPITINGMRMHVQHLNKLAEVLVIMKNNIAIDTPQHYMVNACDT